VASAFELPDGFRLLPGWFDRTAQEALVAEVTAALEIAPLFTPHMPGSGAPMSVRLSNFGPLGWVTDKAKGYRYEPTHPVTGRAWPAMPQGLLDLWDAVADWPDPPEACLINRYAATSRLGMHVDADEDARFAPVVSVSLGDSARFRIGGPRRGDPSRSLTLSSGDVVVLARSARRCHHGVDRILAGTSTLVPDGGRINLTLRRVRGPAGAIT
jgi:alkylated DNA repair protein (DNA oxidative demethylase)